MTWRETVVLIFALPPLIVLVVVLVGLLIDGTAERSEQLAHCRSHAQTMTEYQRC